MTFVAPNLACGEARGGSIPRPWGCDRRATKPQAKFGATRRAAGLFRPDFVARSLQIHCGICSSLTPRLGEKPLAANVIVLMPQTTKPQQRADDGLPLSETPRTKPQAPEKFQISNTNPKRIGQIGAQFCFGAWSLEFGIPQELRCTLHRRSLAAE